MPIVYDEAGARKSSKLLAPDDEFVGAFGDPFTVNRYLLSEIIFTKDSTCLTTRTVGGARYVFQYWRYIASPTWHHAVAF